MQASASSQHPSQGELIDGFNTAIAPDQLAGAYLSVIPQLMAFVRKHLNQDAQISLRLGQFRMLHVLHQNLARSISEAAAVLGVTLPSASKMADDLAGLGLVNRNLDEQDRRRTFLSLTEHGEAVYRSAVDSIREKIAIRFEALSPTERGVLFCAAIKLTEIFQSTGTLSPAVNAVSIHDDVNSVAEHT